MLCGIAGALYVPQVGIINPSEMSPANSIEIAIWVAVGGRGTLIGPILGASSSMARRAFSRRSPEYWLYFARAHLHPRHAVPAARRRGSRAVESVAMSDSRPCTHCPTWAPGTCRLQSRAARGLDTSHGAILYLEGITVSFDGFKALNDLSLRSTRASCAA